MTPEDYGRASEDAARERIEILERRLIEADHLIEAIRLGRVDAFVVEGEDGRARAYTLRSADRPYRIMIERMQEGAITVSPEGTILYANQRFAEMVENSPATLVGRSLEQVVSMEDGPGFDAFLRLTAQNGNHTGEFFLRAGSNRPFPAKVSGNFAGDGEEPMHCLIVTDLTHQRHHDELKQAVKDLESFAYMVSHDLKAPLRSVAGNLEALEKVIHNDASTLAHHHLAQALNMARQMDMLINDLLSFSRVHEIRPQPLQLELAVQRARENLRRDIQDSGAQFTLRKLPLVNADPALVILVFQNLFHNAIKFRSEEPCSITVSAEDHGLMCKVCVQDNGIGIEPKYHTRIFEIFKRINSPERYPGTGIGLALCKRIITRHQGEIWVESEPGKGSRFCFTLPRVG